MKLTVSGSTTVNIINDSGLGDFQTATGFQFYFIAYGLMTTPAREISQHYLRSYEVNKNNFKTESLLDKHC